MEIKLTSTFDEMQKNGEIEVIPAEETMATMERIRETMDSFEVEFKAMQAQSEQIASEVYLTF